jgi:hypothetical protein
MAPATVHLGVAGDLLEETESRSHRDSVAGGLPAFPGAGPPVDAAAHAAAADLAALPPPCPACAAPTALVLQAHAPVPGAPDRALYVFSCVNGTERGGCGGGGCAAGECGWVALRAGLGGRCSEAVAAPSPPASVPAPPPAAAAAPPPPPPPAFGGGGGWDDDDDDDGGSAPATPLDLTALSAELAAAGAALAAAQAEPRRPAAKDAREARPEGGEQQAPPSTTPSWSPQPSASTPTLPAFWVGWEAEPGGPPASTPAEDAHIAALLAAYRAEEGGGEEAVPDDENGGGESGGGGGARCTAGPSSSSSSAKPPAANVSWAGEAYEPDAAPGADAAYMRFAKRIARRPAQVARYHERATDESGFEGGGGSGGGAGGVAWPAEGGPPPPPPCPLCGGPRALELQLVAPLAAMFDEAAAWSAGGGGQAGGGGGDGGGGGGGGDEGSDGGGGGGAPAAWRWLTVGVWACGSADCGGGGGDGGWVAREVVALVNE